MTHGVAVMIHCLDLCVLFKQMASGSEFSVCVQISSSSQTKLVNMNLQSN